MENTVKRGNTGKIRIIQQLDPETKEVIGEYYTTRKAANAIGKPTFFSNIAKACKSNETSKSCGYYWRYETLN